MAKYSRISLLLATAGLLALPLAACEIDGDGDGTDTVSDNGGPDAAGDTQDTVEDDRYFGVLVVDLWNSGTCGQPDTAGCCGSQFEERMAPGADIDAVELLDGSEILGNFDVIREQVNPENLTVCSNNAYSNADAALGAPDVDELFPTADTGYVALEGGWVAGEFTGALEIVPGFAIKVWEVGSQHDLVGEGNDEPFEVHLVEGIDCNPRDGMTDCSLLLSDTAEGTTTIPATGF